jgi:hypothetical protein
VARSRFQKLAMVAMLFGLLAPASRASFIWNTNLGAAISASTFDTDNGVVPETLDFILPFEGTDYTASNSLYISEAGFVWLGGHNTPENTGVGSLGQAEQLFDQGSPRIAPAWYDVDPDLGGNVYFNQTSDEAIITFDAVPSDSSGDATATFQMQLFSTGEIIFSYMLLDSSSLGSDPAALIGVTPGQGDSAVAVDLQNALAGQPMTVPSQGLYDYLQPPLDIVDQSIIFIPQADGSWALNPVPEPATLIPAAAACLLLCAMPKRKRVL